MTHRNRRVIAACLVALLAAFGLGLGARAKPVSANSSAAISARAASGQESRAPVLQAGTASASEETLAQEEPVAPAPNWSEAVERHRSAEPSCRTFAPGSVLVKFRADLSRQAQEGFLAARELAIVRKIAPLGVLVLKVQEGSEQAVAKALAESPEVEYAELDAMGDLCLVPNDPNYYRQWHLPLIGAPAGWDISVGSSSVILADVDTGFDPANRDIGPKLLNGYNVITGTSDTTNATQWGHGTVTASIAAGIGNEAYGTAGVAWNCPILPVVAVDSAGGFPMSAGAAGVVWAADHGARVINMSWIFYTSDAATVTNAVNYAWNKGCVLVAAAGNDNTTDQNGAWTPYPASLPNVLTVAATDSNDVRTSFSNFGYYIKVAAPGYNVITTGAGGSLRSTGGTSMSSPQAAGLAALMLSVNPSLNNSLVMTLIEANADDLGDPGWDPYYGHGRINVGRALQAAQAYKPNQAPALVSAPWATPSSITLGNTTTVNVIASDPDNGPAALTYTWSKVSGSGTVGFSPNGTAGAASSTASFSAAGLYTVRVVVSDGVDTVSGATEVLVTDPNVINAPSNLTGSVSGSTVTLRWTDNSSNETGFQIDRAVKVKSKVTWSSNVATVGANATSFSQTVSNGTYLYRVRALNSSTGKLSANSNEVQVKVGNTGGGRGLSP